MTDFSSFNFASVMNYPDPAEMKVFDFSEGYRPEYVRSFKWGIGRYNEKRRNMYMAPQYENKRNIHVGIDIFSQERQPVFSFYDGVICYTADDDQPGSYGPTLVLRYILDDQLLFGLYGHLSRSSLDNLWKGDRVKKGQKIAVIGSKEENGGWPPHLHFQLSLDDPGKADMPGVVSDGNRKDALKTYPDPRLVTGPLY